MRLTRHIVLLPIALAMAMSAPAGATLLGASGTSPVLHERIPVNDREDMGQMVSVDGDLPAAIDTPSGMVKAPDPRRPINPTDPSTNHNLDASPEATFRPDRDTKRPDVLPYDDPFNPSTAPFKRLMAFDMVDEKFTLSVRDGQMQPVLVHAQPAADGSEEQFYGNLVVELAPGRRVRIPTVGPAARVIHARAGVEQNDVPFRLYRDGAENLFIEGDTATRARLVLQLTNPRAGFGGEFGDPQWAALPVPTTLPPNAARSAMEVAQRIGISRTMRPREVVSKMVAYFRSFADSDEPPVGGRDIYVDLALSKKGVCRHRAFAFLVTALGLGLPTRMVLNEAHAWVEVHDGTLWRRIDLGGAGRTLGGEVQNTVAHSPPPDPFAWPENSTRGDDLADRTRRNGSPGGGANGGMSGGADGGAGGFSGNAAAIGSGSASALMSTSPSASASTAAEKDERPPSTLKLVVTDIDAHRGAPLRVAGQVVADGEPCAHVAVEIILRDARRAREMVLGVAATDDHGSYATAFVVPSIVPLGDYEVVARTEGDARCGRGSAQ